LHLFSFVGGTDLLTKLNNRDIILYIRIPTIDKYIKIYRSYWEVCALSFVLWCS